MKTKSPLVKVAVSVGSTSLLLALAACGGGSDEQSSNAPAPGAVYTPTTTPYGNFNVKCDQSPAQQVQQKVPYQQQQQQQSGGSCSPQFQFYSAVATDFDVNLDCRNGQVIVVGKGIAPTSTAIPIQQDGTWNGQVVLDQSVENDGQGNVFCKVRTIVNFNGNATCNSGSTGKDGLTWTTTVNFAPASNSGSTALLALEASLPPENSSENAPGIAADTLDPSPTPLGTPSGTPSSSVEPGVASPTPSASPSVCTFSDSLTVDSSTLEISIPEGAADLGCSAYGNRAYTVSAGTKVTWTNDDTQPHTVTSDEGSVDSFDSGAILPGQTFSHVFNRLGTIRYHSALDANMQGQIAVERASTPSPSPSPVPTATATAVPPVVVLPGTVPTETPSPTATPSASPSASPSPSPSASPSASPSPSVSPSPGTVPSPTVTQIVSCVVVNPCPIYAQTTQSCPNPAQQ